MKVILVDDERVAVEHLKRLIPWQEHGFEVVATASNGKSALRLCEEHRPQIMIVDIRMPVMDGLELIHNVSEKKLGVKFIVMSAYKDFEYAQQAIALGGVSSYLIKHTVDRDKLLEELIKAKKAWEANEANRHILFSQQLKNLVMGSAKSSLPIIIECKEPFALLLIQVDLPFTTGHTNPVHPDLQYHHAWTVEGMSLISDNQQGWRHIGGFMVSETQLAVLLSSKYKSASLMRETLSELARLIQIDFYRKYKRTFSIFYTIHRAAADTLHLSLANTKKAALHSIFCGKQAIICADDGPLPSEHSPVLSQVFRFDDLLLGLEQKETAAIEKAIISRFEIVLQPIWDLRGLLDLTNALYKLLNDLRIKRGLVEVDPFESSKSVMLYHIYEIRSMFIDLFSRLLDAFNEVSKVPHKLEKALRYIHNHYQEDISINEVAGSAGISSSYLHLLFKRDLNRTFLDYVTNYRIHQAKRILRMEDSKISDVAAKVGYRSTQHFSQVFRKVTGILPHQFKEGGYRF
jgi:two-component system response regulator YesN